MGKSKGHDMTTCDWVGKITPVNQEIAIKTAAEKSTGNKCSGDDDFELVGRDFCTEFTKHKKPAGFYNDFELLLKFNLNFFPKEYRRSNVPKG